MSVQIRSQASEQVYETPDAVAVEVGYQHEDVSVQPVDEMIETSTVIPSKAAVQRLFGKSASATSASIATQRTSRRTGARPSAAVVQSALEHHSRANQSQSVSVPGDRTTDLETPLQTLRRLIFETRQLTEDLLDSSSASGVSVSAANVLPTPPSSRLIDTAKTIESSLAILTNPLALSQGNADGNLLTNQPSILQQTEMYNALANNIIHAKERAATAGRSASPPRSYAAAVLHTAAPSPKVPATPMPAASPKLLPTTFASPRGSASSLAYQPSPPTRAGSMDNSGPPILPSAPASNIWSNSIQYDLYFQSANASFGDEILELERKIGALERLVGGTAAGISDGSVSLLDEISDLDSTLTLLTTPHALARLSRRIQTISGQLERTVTLRRRIIAERQRANRRSYRSDLDDFDSGDENNEEGHPGGEAAAVNELVEVEMEARRAEDERKVGYLFGCLGDRLDPMAATIPVLLARLKGLKLLNAEISSQTVREAISEIEEEQNTVLVERFARVKEGMSRVRTGIRKGARSGVERFEIVEKGVRELVEKVEEVCGNLNAADVNR
ncbi:hypothetical protein HDU77_000623 [Chytriomyces hyalinus]|nr:hypothetical protein HDU77_000623 [Chytriomyces hyalinus]